MDLSLHHGSLDPRALRGRVSRTGRAVASATALCLAFLSAGIQPTAAHADATRDAEWAAKFLSLPQIHDADRGNGVTVGLIDTGVDADHPDLKGNVLKGTDAWNNWKGNGNDDSDGHGTKMASIIAGNGHGKASQNGIIGVAPAAKILPVSVARKSGYIDSKAMGYGIKWAVDRGASVINVSLGGSSSDAGERGVQYALDHDVVVIASIGNTADGAASVQFPAGLDGVIAVSSVGKSGKFSKTSVSDYRADIAAPGVDIIGANPDGGYRTGTGTSDASAFVSGAAALVRARFPKLSAKQVRQRLLQTADDRGPRGHDAKYGDGVLDLVRALDPSVKVSASASPTLSVAPAPSDAAGIYDGNHQSSSLTWAILIGILVLAIAIVLAVIWFVRRRNRHRAQPPGLSSISPPTSSTESLGSTPLADPNSTFGPDTSQQWRRPPPAPPGQPHQPTPPATDTPTIGRRPPPPQ